jgi:hypothetical protein
MFLKKETRIGAAVALVAVLALGLAAPAEAAGWSGWGDAREWSGRIVPYVLSWLGLSLDLAVSPKCDHGSSIDPNGCPRAIKADDGAHIDPNGLLTKSDQGSQIDPNGHH